MKAADPGKGSAAAAFNDYAQDSSFALTRRIVRASFAVSLSGAYN